MTSKVPGPVLSPSMGLTQALDSVPWGNPYLSGSAVSG